MDYPFCLHRLGDPVDYFTHLTVKTLFPNTSSSQAYRFAHVTAKGQRPVHPSTPAGHRRIRIECELTPRGVLQLCILCTPPFHKTKDSYIKDDGHPRHEHPCRDRPGLIEALADALFEYEAGWHAMEEPWVTRGIILTAIDTLLLVGEYLADLRAVHPDKTRGRLAAQTWYKQLPARREWLERLPPTAFALLAPRGSIALTNGDRARPIERSSLRKNLLTQMHRALKQHVPAWTGHTRLYHEAIALVLKGFKVQNTKGKPYTAKAIEKALYRNPS